MMQIRALLTSTLCLTIGLSWPVHADTPILRIAVVEFGTLNWEIDTIDHFGLDEANGSDMEVRRVAGGGAAQVAFHGGEADVIVSDRSSK